MYNCHNSVNSYSCQMLLGTSHILAHVCVAGSWWSHGGGSSSLCTSRRGGSLLVRTRSKIFSGDASFFVLDSGFLHMSC